MVSDKKVPMIRNTAKIAKPPKKAIVKKEAEEKKV
jgi:hypothetical protein